MASALDAVLAEIAACRLCRDEPQRKPLPHEPRPVLRASPTARIVICGQAPGTRVHASGMPFTDPSGDRLRAWMGIDSATFYDRTRIAIVPMGFCFPGLDTKGGDLPPRPECAPRWRHRVFEQLPELRLMLLVGSYAIKWHMKRQAKASLSETVAAWRTYGPLTTIPGTDAPAGRTVSVIPLPHPSWRNNAWLKRNPWFEQDLLPELQSQIARCLKLS